MSSGQASARNIYFNHSNMKKLTMKIIYRYVVAAIFLVATFGFAANTYSQSVDESDADNLPLPSSLFAKHIEAVGGEENLRAHTTRTIYGILIINAYNITGDIEIVAEAPNKLSTTIELGQFGTSRSGYNGTVGWSMDPMSGNRVLQGEALQGMIQSSDFYADNLNLGKGAIKQETIETVTFEDGEQYKVLLVDENGEESTLYFSKETGLLSGMDRMQFGLSGRVPTEIRLSNYVEFDGIKTASKFTSVQSGIKTIVELDSVSYAPPADNAFELPAVIQSKIGQ